MWRRFTVHSSQLRRFRARMETEWRPDLEPSTPEDDRPAVIQVEGETGSDQAPPDSPPPVQRTAGTHQATQPKETVQTEESTTEPTVDAEPPTTRTALDPESLVGNTTSRFGRQRRAKIDSQFDYR